MNIFGFFTNKPKSKDIAKDRLKLVLIHDRGDFSPEKLEAIKKDLKSILEKYIEIDTDNIEVSVVRQKDTDSEAAYAHLNTNIPIKKIK